MTYTSQVRCGHGFHEMYQQAFKCTFSQDKLDFGQHFVTTFTLSLTRGFISLFKASCFWITSSLICMKSSQRRGLIRFQWIHFHSSPSSYLNPYILNHSPNQTLVFICGWSYSCKAQKLNHLMKIIRHVCFSVCLIYWTQVVNCI